MTFANVSVDRKQLLLLSQLLLAVFPGCTIHQNRDPVRLMQHLTTQKVDAMFVDADMRLDWKRISQEHGSCPTIYLLSRQELPLDDAGSVRGVVTYPLTKQKIQNALQNVSREIREVI